MREEERAQILRALSELAERPPRSIEELRFRIEELRPLRAAAVPLLVERLERDDPQDVAAAVLQELVDGGDADVLVAAFRRTPDADKTRTSLAQLLAGVASDRLEELLTEDELHEVSRLSIDELLDRMRDRDGLTQAIQLYRSCGRSERRALLAAVEEATDRPAAPLSLASALETLFPEEPDERLRAQMVYLLAERRQPDSARVLTRWRARLRGPERGLVDRALERLLRSGVRPAPVARAAWLSGVDGTACFNLGISFPAPLGLRDVVLACVSLESGLRAVSLLSAVENETIDEIQHALEEGQGIPVAPLEVVDAFRMLDEAKARTLELGRKLPEGYRDALAYLERPLALWKRGAETTPPIESTGRRLPALLDLPGYRSWTFDPSEAARDGADDRAAAPETARQLLERLAAGATAPRLVAMLQHQASVHRLRGETAIASRSQAAARDIETRGLARSLFALRLAERSIPYLERRAPRTARSDVREPLKRRLEAGGKPLRRNVAVLDLGEALYREIENVNDGFPPTDRLTLAQMESTALAAAEIATAEFTRDSTEEPALPGLEVNADVKPGAVRRRLRLPATRIRLESAIVARLREETGVFTPSTRRLAEALARVAVWFADEVCLGRCGRDCLVDPLADGRSIFYAPGHPAGIDLSSAEPRGAGAAPPASRAIQRYLGRRLEARAEAIREFLDGLAGLAGERGDEERVTKLENLRNRLLRAREEVEALDRDPAALYGFVDQSLVLAEDAAALARPLLVEALRALPAPVHERRAGDPHALVVRRRLERALRTLGLLEVDAASLEAAVALAPRPGSLVALFELATASRPAHVLRSLKATIVELWNRSRGDAVGSGPLAPR